MFHEYSFTDEKIKAQERSGNWPKATGLVSGRAARIKKPGEECIPGGMNSISHGVGAWQGLANLGKDRLMVWGG